jgi:two-component system sensor histidine kinase PilS (NtrC family)
MQAIIPDSRLVRDTDGEVELPTGSYWRSLQYFSLYRLVIAAFFVVAFNLLGGTTTLGSQSAGQFDLIGYAYLLAAYGFLLFVRRVRRAFDFQLSVQVGTDILALTLLMYASGGAKSGIAVMLVVAVAGAGLVGQGRLTLLYASLATLAVLLEHAYRVLHFSAETEGFFRVGLISIGFFATAITAQLLARRVVANESLARRRGVELANQLRISQQVILDMQDGVLVVDRDGQVRQHNPQAEVLLDVHPPEDADLRAFSPDLAVRYALLGQGKDETEKVIQVAGSGRLLRVRFLPPGEGGYALIYMEDISRIQAQAQQIKLAALGRLTANIAHEIRNPLAAISHAAELLGEERREDTAVRLTRIIGDNARRLNRLVGEVLELGRRDRVQAESIPLAGFLQQLLEEYSLHDPTVSGRATLLVTPDAVIHFDRAHLHQVVENLLANALRHASQNAGAVRLEARAVSATQVELHIIDDGTGIEADARAHVFEPFFTTHSSGTGLGLYIARELCEANGAILELAESVKGAHFCIVAKREKCQHTRNGGDVTT